MLLFSSCCSLVWSKSLWQRKSPPELQLCTHTTSGFISNVGNLAYCNRCSNELMDLHHEMGGVKSPTNAPLATMTERVQKRMLYKFSDQSTTPATKRVTGRPCMHIACKDTSFTSVIDLLQNVQCSQEMLNTCLELQHAMD
jgi:hypothetical protein